MPRIGFCCGAFDLLHPGHILMLADAADQCDYLIVGLHTDPSIERPEKNKPVMTVDERIMMLQAIKYVNQIVTYSTEAELSEILNNLRPDVRVIGSDWKGKEITAPNAAKTIYWHERKHDWSTSRMRTRVTHAQFDMWCGKIDLNDLLLGLSGLIERIISIGGNREKYTGQDAYTVSVGIVSQIMSSKQFVCGCEEESGPYYKSRWVESELESGQ